MTTREFLQVVNRTGCTKLELAVALLWYISREDQPNGLSASAIAEEIEAVTATQQNSSRLDGDLRGDNRVSVKRDIFRLRVSARDELDNRFNEFIDTKPIPITNSILPLTLFGKARSYLTKTANHLNFAYDQGLYDCASLMARKLVENLIIEVYEAESREAEIQDGTGNYRMLDGLISYILNDRAFHLQRGTKEGLPEIKNLGDLSAHARRFGTTQGDINRIRHHVRQVCDELLHLANQNA